MIVKIGDHKFTLIWDNVYYFSLSNYPLISSWELKKLLTFIDYENEHKRNPKIECENEDILKKINDAITNPFSIRNTQIPNKITECTSCKQKGCLTKFVCHTAALDNAKKIMKCGKLLSALKASNKAIDELICDVRNGAGDPADYFEYIMFAWGNCFAGDSLVVERNLVNKLGRSPNEEELNNELKDNFTPGIRFYFQYCDLIKHPNSCFDGYHAIKIKDELMLSDYLYACIIPENYKSEIESLIPNQIMNRVSYLPLENLGMIDWANKTYNYILAQ